MYRLMFQLGRENPLTLVKHKQVLRTLAGEKNQREPRNEVDDNPLKRE